jgi:chitodextrinase
MQRYSFVSRSRVALGFVSLILGLGSQSVLAADTQAPTTPGSFTNTSVTVTSASFSWTASTDNVAVTAYLIERCTGAGCSNFVQVAASSYLTYTNAGLAIQATYNYRIRARDAAGNFSGYSPILTATTPPDTQAPTTPTNVVITVLSNTQLKVSWTASSDNASVTNYLVERCSGASCTTFAEVATQTAVTYTNTGLVPNTAYSYRVRAKDAANNFSPYSSVASSATPPDILAPTIPGGITATANSNTMITVTWTASTDDVGVTGYRVERCQSVNCLTFVQVATPTGPSFGNADLVAGSRYSYRVVATDATGNLSGYSAIATASTTGADVTVPTAPTGLTSMVTSGTQVNLTWIASSDNMAVTNYLIERCQGVGCVLFTEVATSASASYGDSGRAPATSYSYRVRATDAANNVGGYSNIHVTTTPSGTVDCD